MRFGLPRAARMDLAPLRGSADFRFVFASRTVTLLGTIASDVALLVQAKQLTGSTLAVGALGVAELVPVLLFGLYGGVLADRLYRRRVIRWAEAGLACAAALLVVNASLPRPALWPLYALAAGMTALAALQRPSLDAAMPRLLPPPEAGEHGPALGLRSVVSGLRYARGRQELVGSYLADLAAMTFAYPNALFPFMAVTLHAPWAVGLMFAAPSAGALAVSATSGWMGRVRRHGRAIALAAGGGGRAITGFGFAPDIGIALACLVLAGAADMLSGIFRDTLWNQTIPDSLRGRLAGVELLSYSVGPSAGQLRAGGVAALTSTRFSLWSGGLLCLGGVGLVCLALPGFHPYQARRAAPPPSGDSSVPGEPGGG